MKKKISFRIEDEERIKKLVDSVKNNESIRQIYGSSLLQIRHLLHDLPTKSLSRLDEDYWIRMNAARDVAIFVMADAVKKIISEDNYKNIVLSIAAGNLDIKEGRMTCGNNRIESGKAINTIYLNSIENLASGNIGDFIYALNVFAHELYHAKQYFDSQNGELTISNLIYCLERIAYSNRDEYYKNYDSIYFEQQAFLVGAVHSYDFAKLFADKEIDKTEYVEAIMISKKNWQNVLFDFDTQCNYVKELLNNIDRKNIKISKEYLKKFPILKYVYDGNGVLYEGSKSIDAITRCLNDKKTSEDEKKFLNLLVNVFQDNQVKKSK